MGICGLKSVHLIGRSFCKMAMEDEGQRRKRYRSSRCNQCMPIWDLVGGIGSHAGAICLDPAKIIPFSLAIFASFVC